MLDDATKERIDQISSEDVILYMKGTPVFHNAFLCRCCWVRPISAFPSGDQCAGR